MINLISIHTIYGYCNWAGNWKKVHFHNFWIKWNRVLVDLQERWMMHNHNHTLDIFLDTYLNNMPFRSYQWFQLGGFSYSCLLIAKLKKPKLTHQMLKIPSSEKTRPFLSMPMAAILKFVTKMEGAQYEFYILQLHNKVHA